MSWRPLASPAFLVALAILVVAALSMGRAIGVMGIYLEKLPIQPEHDRKLRQILTETDNWRRVGDDVIEAADVVESLETDNYVTRTYVAKVQNPRDAVGIDFHAAYYTGMIDTVPHVPERCFVGGGWQIAADSHIVDIPLDSTGWLPMDDSDDPIYEIRVSNRNKERPGQRVPLPRGVTPRGGLKMRVTEFFDSQGRSVYAGYFFIANGGTVASAEGVRLLAFDLTDDYAYYLKVQFTSPQVGSAEELASIAGRLLDDLMPEIMLCVPDWTKVEAGTYPPARSPGDS